MNCATRWWIKSLITESLHLNVFILTLIFIFLVCFFVCLSSYFAISVMQNVCHVSWRFKYPQRCLLNDIFISCVVECQCLNVLTAGRLANEANKAKHYLQRMASVFTRCLANVSSTSHCMLTIHWSCSKEGLWIKGVISGDRKSLGSHLQMWAAH